MTEEYITPGEAARLFGVTTKTIVKWDKAGKIKSIRTLGNHRRFLRADLEAAMNPQAGE